MVVVLSDLFRGMGAWRNSTETQQSDHAPRSGPEVKNGKSTKDGVLERLRCGTVQKEASQILQMVSAGAARKIPPPHPAQAREGCGLGSAAETAKGQPLRGNQRNPAEEEPRNAPVSKKSKRVCPYCPILTIFNSRRRSCNFFQHSAPKPKFQTLDQHSSGKVFRRGEALLTCKH